MVAAVILAGGRSSRMGHDKALISLGAETLLQRTCRVALACADTVYVVTPWCDRYRPLVPDSVQFIEEKPSPGATATFHGPLMALVQALSWLHQCPKASSPWVLALACDMPNLSAATLNLWRSDLDTIPSSYLAYLPQRQHRWEPLCGFYRMAALGPLRQYATAATTPEARVGSKGPSLQAWLNLHPVQTIAPVDAALLANLNTPAELEAWQQARRPPC
ncbi:MAG TPA: molybdenum cofactor guanylyltransferase [Nodosilinea sp.]|nr:molybdenum cofactor guanylyltransferase [Nodosilinea sp.]